MYCFVINWCRFLLFSPSFPRISPALILLTFNFDVFVGISPGGLYGTDCTACPAPAFCTLGSILPRQCPAGTFLGTTAAEAESECQDCPQAARFAVVFGGKDGKVTVGEKVWIYIYIRTTEETPREQSFCQPHFWWRRFVPPTLNSMGFRCQGFRCSMPVIVDYDQSDVLRLPNGEPIAGSLGPDVCTEDEAALNHWKWSLLKNPGFWRAYCTVFYWYTYCILLLYHVFLCCSVGALFKPFGWTKMEWLRRAS